MILTMIIMMMMNRMTSLLWSKNSRKLETGYDHGMDGSITIANVQKRHEGIYRCTVTTVMDQASDEVVLKVLVNAPVITSWTRNKKLFSGTSLKVECISTGIPEPVTSWTFNSTITSAEGPGYVINNAIATDSGNYTCIARNSIGETRKTIQLAVVTVPTMMKELQARNLISNPIV